MFTLLNYIGPGSMLAFLQDIPFEQHSVRVYGKTHPQPRLVKWYGQVNYRYSGLTLPASPLTGLLEEVRRHVESQSGHVFNSVLCNLYRDGQDHVGWHADDEAIFGGDPVVASVSFGTTRLFKVRRKDDHHRQRTYKLEDRSLLVMEKGVQREWQHTLPKTKFPGMRINLTFRETV